MADHTEITQVKKESKEGKGRTIQKYPAFLRYILQKAHQNNQPDLQMAYRLIHLQRQAKLYQYLFACISTLGGANHLCNRPQEALVLAERQCLVARMLGSKKLYIKSRVFIAVNYALLKKRKKSEKIFQECIFLSSQIQCNDTLHFIKAIKLWLLRELAIEDMNYCKGKKGYSDMGRVNNPEDDRDGSNPISTYEDVNLDDCLSIDLHTVNVHLYGSEETKGQI